MKFLAVLALCVVAVAGRSRNTIQETGPACPIEHVVVGPGREFNVSLAPVLVINPGAVRGDLISTGLDTLSYEYTVTLLTLTVDFEINLPSIDLACDSYSNVVGWIDATPFRQETLPTGNFTGTGAAALTATGVHLKAQAVLFINLISDKISCRELTVEDLSFDSLSADLGQEYLVDGKPIDWAAWSASFKANFLQDWAASETAIVDKVRLAANNLLGNYTLQEFLDLIGNIGGEPGACPTPAP